MRMKDPIINIIIINDNSTEDETAFVEKIDKERRQHAEAQKEYRNRKAQDDPQYREKFRTYMKNYNEKKQIKYTSIKKNY